MNENTKIKCPNCSTAIDVQDILAHQLEGQIRAENEVELQRQRKTFSDQTSQLQAKQAAFASEQKNAQQALADQLADKERILRQELGTQIRKKAAAEQEDRFKVMQEELNEKAQQVKELHRSRAEIEQLKRQQSELKDAAKAEAQAMLTEHVAKESVRIQKAEQDKNELKFRELVKQLEDQKKLTEEMKRKQEQGSMQLQGEVQELAIEAWLRSAFPLDTIEEIKTGARGGDCIQTVHTREQQNCGSIYYESKRTKSFQPAWIEKFKADIREKNADIGVLITNALPVDMDRMGMRGGVWICTFDEFKGLCSVLRQSVIRFRSALATQENRGDKMHLLYDYLTGTEFRMQFEAIVEGFTQLQEDLNKEKRAMQNIWKKREKQIDKVIMSTAGMYGSIKGIAGKAVHTVEALELDDSEADPSPFELES